MHRCSAVLSLIVVHTLTLTAEAERRPNYAISEAPDASASLFIQTPFEAGGEYDGLIFVDVGLNGRDARFILDTGAPALVLNSAHFPDETAEAEGEAVGVSGKIQLRQIAIDELDWQGIKRRDIELIGIDLAHLETAVDSEIVGLIGYNTVKDFELLIDYPDRRLTLFRPGATNLHRDVQPLAEIPFTLEAHIPVIEVEIDGETLRLGLDTGAAVNLLDPTAFASLDTTAYRSKGEDVLHGADKNANTVPLVEVLETEISGLRFADMLTSVADISHLNNGYGLQLDGLIGFPFLSQRRISINFAERKLYVWDAAAEVSPASVSGASSASGPEPSHRSSTASS